MKQLQFLLGYVHKSFLLRIFNGYNVKPMLKEYYMPYLFVFSMAYDELIKMLLRNMNA